MQKFIWLSFDLGVRGDYEGMYSWLDSHDAKECGDSVAGLEYTFERDLLTELAKEIRALVQITRKTRVYVIRQEEGKMKGKFIIGNRRTPPWAGFSEKEGHDEDTGDEIS